VRVLSAILILLGGWKLVDLNKSRNDSIKLPASKLLILIIQLMCLLHFVYTDISGEEEVAQYDINLNQPILAWSLKSSIVSK